MEITKLFNGETMVKSTKQYFIPIREGIFTNIKELKSFEPLEFKNGKPILPKGTLGFKILYTTLTIVRNENDEIISNREKEIYVGPAVWIGEKIIENGKLYIFNKAENKKTSLQKNERVLAEDKVEYLKNVETQERVI